RRQPPHPALHEYMGRKRGALLERLLDHQAVALHHIARDIGIAFVGGVGDHVPAVCGGIGDGVPHGVVEGSFHAANLCAVGGDRTATALAYCPVHVDDAAAAEGLCAPGHRSAVIAVGGAGD